MGELQKPSFLQRLWDKLFSKQHQSVEVGVTTDKPNLDFMDDLYEIAGLELIDNDDEGDMEEH